MIGYPRTRRGRDRGFTLIELLVVIVILGIISGVVVFAVRGMGSKGQEEAADAEARILRTAQEAHCARFGRYAATFQELKDKKLLSTLPGYHEMSFNDQEGPCGNTSYSLYPTPDTSCPPADRPPGATGGFWCLADDLPGEMVTPSETESLVQLGEGNGKVLAILQESYDLPPEPGTGSRLGNPTALFDPTAGPRGAWSPGPVAYAPPSDFVGFSTMLLLTGDRCGSNCGKVLAHFRAGTFNSGETLSHWKLYDPSGDDGVAGTAGAWSSIQPQSPFPRGSASALQLRGPGCAAHCGKVLIVGQSQVEDPAGLPMAELYDPALNTFQAIGLYADPGESFIYPHLTELADGRVLLVVADSTGYNPGSQAFLIDLADGTSRPVPGRGPFVEGGRSNYLYEKYRAPYRTVDLPDQGVFFVRSSVAGEIYRPEARPGVGSWDQDRPPGCSPTVSDESCVVLSRLRDGRVLVMGTFPDTYLFDPAAAGPKWSDAANRLLPATGRAVALLANTPCAPNCDKVLTAGGNRAALYNP